MLWRSRLIVSVGFERVDSALFRELGKEIGVDPDIGAISKITQSGLTLMTTHLLVLVRNHHKRLEAIIITLKADGRLNPEPEKRQVHGLRLAYVRLPGSLCPNPSSLPDPAAQRPHV